MHLRIATRKSKLALYQAEFVGAQLLRHHPDLNIEYIPFVTSGDKMLEAPLAKVGGKGLFLKELEQALLRGEADIAVHSMKDVTVFLPEGLNISAICERDDPRDVFVSNKSDFFNLPEHAVIGTSSLRRISQVKCLRQDLEIKNLRGNIITRIEKLESGEFDGIILAAAGLDRLSMQDKIRHYFDVTDFLPAVAQGALGVECREDDEKIQELLRPLNHLDSKRCVLAERAMNEKLEGGCQVPIAGFAKIVSGRLELTGMVASLDGATQLVGRESGSPDDYQAIGDKVAEKLIDQGAKEIISSVYQESN